MKAEHEVSSEANLRFSTRTRSFSKTEFYNKEFEIVRESIAIKIKAEKEQKGVGIDRLDELTYSFDQKLAKMKTDIGRTQSLPDLQGDSALEVLRLKSEGNFKKVTGKNSTDGDGVFCRVCYETSDSDKNKLITPCICQGSMKYIHQDCLKKWIGNPGSTLQRKASCEICMTPYLIRLKYNSIFSKPKFCEFLERLGTTSTVVLFTLIIVCTLLYVVVTKSSDLTEENKYVLLMCLIILSVLIMSLILYSYLRRFKSECYIEELDDWTVLSIREKQDLPMQHKPSSPVLVQTNPNIVYNNYVNQRWLVSPYFGVGL